MASRLSKPLFLLTVLCLLGCGFHLRGIISLPTKFNNVAIVVQNVNRDVAPALKEQLLAYHINVQDQPEQAFYWIILEQDKEDQQITSVSSSTNPRQYQLKYTLSFKFQEANGKELIPSTQVTTTRQLTINSNRILGSNFEENTLKHEMRNEAVIQIIDRIGHRAL